MFEAKLTSPKAKPFVQASLTGGMAGPVHLLTRDDARGFLGPDGSSVAWEGHTHIAVSWHYDL